MDILDEKELEKLKRERKKAEKKDNLKEVAQICNCIGELLVKYGRCHEAKEEHEKELAISEALEDTIGSAVACRKIGECYCGMDQYDKALQFQQRHLELSRSCGNLLEEQRALATIGRTYLFQCDSARGKQNIVKASKQAEEAFCKSLTACENLKQEVKNVEYMEMKARLFLNLGLVFDGRGDTRQCAEYMKKAITISEQHHLYSDLYRCQYSLATMYQRNNNFSQALRFLESALKSALKLKDKYLESDVYVQKALVCIQVGDIPTSKHSLKKAHKLGSPTPEETERIVKYFKAVGKIEEATTSLEGLPPDGNASKIKIYEQLGDGAAEIGNFKQALEFYHKMLDCSIDEQSPGKDLIPIYISLAQTYADNKQYGKAVEYYNKEKECRGEDYGQICRTWLNIAECQELDGKSYDDVSMCYMKAFECARKANHYKLQVHVLKSLVEVQKYYKQKTHLKQTERKLDNIKTKFDVGSDEELSEEERDSQRSDDVENLSISELSESEESEEEGSKVKTGSRRATKAKATRNEKGETPLHRACIEGNLKKVQKLIEQGHPVNPRDHCGWIPLHEAANHDVYEIVLYLLDHGAAINDRGGQYCGGVTPLIDSGNCGNMEIMDLLIERGANVLAKDDEGNSALDCLRAWRDRCDNLDDELLKKFQHTEKLLASKKRGKSSVDSVQRSQASRSLNPSQRSQRVVEECDLPHLPLQERAKKRKSKTGHSSDLRRGMSSSDSDSDSQMPQRQRKTSPVLSDSEEFFPNPMMDDEISTTQSATASYKSAIENLRGHVNRKTVPSQNVPTSKQQQTSALIDEEIFVDDWLIDDMHQPTKRQKLDINGVFSSNSSRKKSEEVLSQKASSSSIKKNRSIIFDDDSEDINIDTSVDIHSNNRIGDDNILIDEDDISIISQRTQLPSIRRLQKTKPRQLSLTNFAVRVSENRSVSQDTAGIENATSFLATTGPTSTQTTIDSTPSSYRDTVGPLMRIKVRVKDKLLLIPVPNSEKEKTIAWLCKEAGQRYYSMCGLRPLLTLSTKDGAFLANTDEISQVLSSNEEVEGVVDSWDLPPLVDRYQQACTALNTVCYRNIKTILQSCDSTSKLVISDLGLRPLQIQTVFRALQCQNTLKVLCLPGNRMGDNGLDSFLKVCNTLPNLSVLNFKCNEITAVGLKSLSDFLQNCETPVLKNLMELNLSYNSLGDSSCQSLASIVTHLPMLNTLSLSSCDFTAKLFQQHRISLMESLLNCQLQNLDVSHNQFGMLGIELLLKTINPATMWSLNIDSTLTSAPQSYFLLHIQNFLSKDKCSLQDLNLSGCHLSTDHTDFLVSIPIAGKSLTSLNLSDNPKLDNSVVTRVLEVASTNNTHLEKITAEGCGIVSPLDTMFLDAISDKLMSDYSLKFISFTCRNLDKVDVDSLSQIWTEHWKDSAQIQISSSLVRLSVSST
ncbi:tonsoku-like protein [Mytilus edulis]|uniref:tonsoku-like protein n=3 Tax=Mytilus edulis TaxID=6550 RepID=UPI0039EFB1DB